MHTLTPVIAVPLAPLSSQVAAAATVAAATVAVATAVAAAAAVVAARARAIGTASVATTSEEQLELACLSGRAACGLVAWIVTLHSAVIP